MAEVKGVFGPIIAVAIRGEVGAVQVVVDFVEGDPCEEEAENHDQEESLQVGGGEGCGSSMHTVWRRKMSLFWPVGLFHT